MRRKREEKERNTGRPSSWRRRRSGRKEADRKRKIRKARAGGKHLRNSCGSESGKGERKHTGSLSTENREGTHGKPGGKERGRPKERKRGRSTEEATVRRRQEEKGKEETEAE